MGGGNPISVAANFRLVFDTRSATRTATRYDAAMAQMANSGHKAMAQSNSKLEQEHSKLLSKVKKDNAAALVEIRKLVWAKEPRTKPKAKTVQQTGRGVQKAYKNICKEVLSSDIFYP